MSFTSTVRNEISKIETLKGENIAELSAIVHNSEISLNSIKIYTENASAARKIYSLFKDLYSIYAKITVRKGYNYNNNLIYIIEVNNNVQKILSSLGIYYNNSINNIPEEYIVDDIDHLRAYFRGLFLITGSINDPKKSRYHLEFLFNNENYASYIIEKLSTFFLNAKQIKRDSKYMVYIKEAEKIGDFLRIISASNAVLYYEDIRIYRDHKNMTNRLNNMEQANVDKMLDAASKQVKDIEIIKSIGGLLLLDDKAKMVAEYRLKYPDVSLLELSEIITYETGIEITKSGVNHKINKIKLLADKIKKS